LSTHPIVPAPVGIRGSHGVSGKRIPAAKIAPTNAKRLRIIHGDFLDIIKYFLK
jgi:hypothetical protein